MKVTLVQPTTGRIGDKKFKRPWTLEPLNIAVLAGLTPSDTEITFYDDRLEDVCFDNSPDLVGISVETMTALRSYEIAKEFRKRNIPVILGGVHPTLLPEEASKYADSVVVGLAENLGPLY